MARTAILKVSKLTHVVYFGGVALGMHEVSSVGAGVMLVCIGLAYVFKVEVE